MLIHTLYCTCGCNTAFSNCIERRGINTAGKIVFASTQLCGSVTETLLSHRYWNMDGDLWNYVVHLCSSNSFCMYNNIQDRMATFSFIFSWGSHPSNSKIWGYIIYYEYNFYKRFFIMYYLILTSGAGLKDLFYSVWFWVEVVAVYCPISHILMLTLLLKVKSSI